MSLVDREQVLDNDVNLLLFSRSVYNLGSFCPPSLQERGKRFLWILLGRLKVSSSDVYFEVVFVLLIEGIADIIPGPLLGILGQ